MANHVETKVETHDTYRPKLHWLAPLLRLKVIHSAGKSLKKSHFTSFQAKRASVILVHINRSPSINVFSIQINSLTETFEMRHFL